MNVKSLVLAAATSGMLLTGANAANFVVQSDIADYEAHKTVSTGVLAVSNGTAGDNRIGSRTSTTLSSSILPFALPAIPLGDEITAATLSVTFEGESAALMIEAGDGNVDLYGLPFNASPLVQDANRYFSGPIDSATGVTKLQDNIFTVAEYPAESTFVTKVSVDISAYLESLYAGGAVAGDFAILRLSYDIDALSGNNRYRVVTSGGDGSTVGTFDPPSGTPHTIAEGAPFLDITTAPIPEPTSIALAGIGALGLLARRRR